MHHHFSDVVCASASLKQETQSQGKAPHAGKLAYKPVDKPRSQTIDKLGVNYKVDLELASGKLT